MSPARSHNHLCITRDTRGGTDQVMQTLELMELHGGEEACKKIKSLIPTYQSAVEGVSVSKTFWSVKAA